MAGDRPALHSIRGCANHSDAAIGHARRADRRGGKDSRGGVVEDLTRQDFTIKDEGKPRAIQIFSINRGEPEAVIAPPLPQLPPHTFSNQVAIPGAASIHATVILLDTINDYFDNYARSRDQVVRLIRGLRPDERVAIYVLSQFQGLLILQDYTTDRDLLTRNLNAYIPSGMSPAPAGMGRAWRGCPVARHTYQAGA